MKRELFITGTDTAVGKTMVSSLLLAAMLGQSRQYWSPRYFKPVQAGDIDDSDTQTVLRLSGLAEERIQSPTYSLCAPMSPDRAAALENIEIDLQSIVNVWQGLGHGDWVIEGAGGVEVPLNHYQRIGDLIARLNVPALLVASTRLGTINHTLLSIKALQQRGICVRGVVLVGDQDDGLAEYLQVQTKLNIVAQIPKFNSIEPEFIRSVANEYFNQRVLTEIFSSVSTPVKKYGHIWHPFTQHGLKLKPSYVRSARATTITLSDGAKVIDAISSWWVNLHGHGHPAIVNAIAEQAQNLDHVIFSGFTHQPAEDLSAVLIAAVERQAPKLNKVFFSDNGSTSVEVALKMAFQYQCQIGHVKRKRFIALKGSYHGDTLAAMSVSDPDGYHQVFQPLMMPVDFVTPGNIDDLERLLTKQPHNYAAMIIEPMIQGAGGMNIYAADYLAQIAQLCSEHGILLICDEVFTGFYRTGKYFAYQHANIQPDLLCLSKGITGGVLPLAATLATENIYSAFLSDQIGKAFLHGHSYTANPIACAAALASNQLLQTKACQERIQRISQITTERVQALAGLAGVTAPRSIGTIGAVNIDNAGDYFSSDFSYRFRSEALQRGVLLRPLGSVVYSVPPYCTSDAELHQIYDTIEGILNEF